MTEILKRYNTLPSLFSPSLIDHFLDGIGTFEKAFTEASGGYPYDIIVERDSTGRTTQTELVYAIAGVPKESVNVEITGDYLKVNIGATNKEEDPTKTYLRKAISRRSVQHRFILHDVNKQNIKATVENGELRIILPAIDEETVKINIQ